MKKRVALIGDSVFSFFYLLENGNNEDIEIYYFSSNPLSTGHFSGVQIDDRHYDLGMVLFEFESYYDKMGSIGFTSYSQEGILDSGRFTNSIKKYLCSHGLNFKAVPSIKTYYKNHIYEDFVITNHLDLLKGLSGNEKTKALSELKNINHITFHPKSKKKWKEDINFSLKEVLINNYGPTIYKNIIEPYVVNFSGSTDVSQLSGSHHRAVWVPLYYPESLIHFLETHTQNFKSIEFHYPEGQSLSEHLLLLSKKINLSHTNMISINEIESITSDGNKNYIVNKNKEQLDVDIIFYGGNDKIISQHFGLNPHSFDKSSIIICYIEVKNSNKNNLFSVINIIDSNNSIYRITNSSDLICSNSNKIIWTVELKFSSSNLSKDDFVNLIKQELISMSLIDSSSSVSIVKKVIAKNSLLLPSFNNLFYQNEIHSTLKKQFNNLHFVGAASPLGAKSFNDQICMALKMTELY